MTKWKGCHWCASFCILVLASISLLTPKLVSAEESVNDILTMLNWWEEYGRFWDEMDADASIEDMTVFALADTSLKTSPTLIKQPEIQ